jgi:Fe2+ transport system protein FeoA
MTLNTADKNIAYNIDSINTREEGMMEFLFTLGCFPGELITVLSHVSSNYVINIKNARYSIDDSLARAIEVREADELRQIV